jgi:hypothetical protein
MADFECKSGAMALSVLETIANSLEGVKRNALLACRQWVSKNTYPIPEDYEERKRLYTELMEERRNLMTKEERIKEAQFYLDGIEGEGLQNPPGA